MIALTPMRDTFAVVVIVIMPKAVVPVTPMGYTFAAAAAVAVPKAVVPVTPMRYTFAAAAAVAVPKAVVPVTPVIRTSGLWLPKVANESPANEVIPNIGYLSVKSIVCTFLCSR